MDRLKNIIKKPITITLIVYQLICIVFILLKDVHPIFSILFIIGEGLFLVILGIYFFLKNKEVVREKQLINEMPYNDEQLLAMKKAEDARIKNNKIVALTLIVMGVLLIITCIKANI